MSIAVFGSVNIDLTTYSAELPRPGETLHGDRYAIGLGGKGCNQAVAVSKLGAPTELIGRIGEDGFGDTARSALRRLGVSTNGVLVDPESDTGVAVIGVDSRAENCITVIGGANMAIDLSDVARMRETFERAKVLLLQMEIPLDAGLAAADMVRENGGLVILDPAPAPKGGLDSSVLQRIDIITPNETETEILTGQRPGNAKEAAKAAHRIRERGASVAVIKLGADGVYFQSGDGDGFVPPFKVDSVDSVAAGDCFNGGLAHALAAGKVLGEAVRFAAACGALSTTRAGASDSAPSLAEVEALLADQ
ncbi:MAG: ribokinase [Rhodospirillales bacterium]|nr:ribokinase [Rhodospirillales bacterium]